VPVRRLEPMMRRVLRSGVAVVLATLLVLTATAPAHAGWLTRLLDEAGDAASDAASGAKRRLGGDGVDAPGTAFRAIPVRDDRVALVARPGKSGHWTFTNRTGETFTAANPDEMARVLTVLAPSVDGRPVDIIINEADAFAPGARFDALPSGTTLKMRIAGERAPVPMRRTTAADGARVSVRLRPSVTVTATRPRTLREAIAQLQRHLDPQRLSLVSLTHGAPPRPTDARRGLTERDGLRAEPIRAAGLAAAMASFERRTVIVVGRLTGNTLTYRGARGIEQDLDLAPVRSAAAAHDVNLIVIDADTPRQPGIRNWLWQEAAIDGLASDLRQSSLADLLDQLGGRTGQLDVNIRETGGGRTRLRAERNSTSLTDQIGSAVGRVMQEIMSETLGTVVPSGIDADVTSIDRARELDRRIIPGVPSAWQWGYLGLLLIGLFGLGPARAWWFAVWPPEQRSDYDSAVGYHLAATARIVVFTFVYLPIVALPAAVAVMIQSVWSIVSWPFRAAAWIAGRRATSNGG